MGYRTRMRMALVLLALAHASARALTQPAQPAQLNDNGACSPTQVHIALTGDPTELMVSWKTASGSCPSTVDYWHSASGTNPLPPALQQQLGDIASYDNRDFCSSPARDYETEPQYYHHVVLRGLAPGEKYIYRVANGREIPVRAPLASGPKSRFTFLAYGDMGDPDHYSAKSPGAAATQSRVMQEVMDGAELILHVGDISYANGRQEIWDSFMDSIQPFASRVPYHVAVGNHEIDYEKPHKRAQDPSGADGPYSPDWGNFGNDSGGECGVTTAATFAMPDAAELGYWPLPNCTSAPAACTASSANALLLSPRNPTLGPNGAAASAGSPSLSPTSAAPADGQLSAMPSEAAARNALATRGPAPNPPFWYSFSYGSVHFVMISTEHDAAPGSEQYEWLKEDFLRVDRCKTPWLVVSMHRPMYVVFPHKSNRVVGDHIRDQLEGLFNDNEVDLVISGHVHSYARTCNVLDEECIEEEQGGMTHITVGSAGRKLSDVEHEQPTWLQYAESRFGYGRVKVQDGFSLTWQFVHTEDGRVHDWVTIYNKRTDRRGCNYSAWDPQPVSSSSGGALKGGATAAAETAAAAAEVAAKAASEDGSSAQATTTSSSSSGGMNGRWEVVSGMLRARGWKGFIQQHQHSMRSTA